MLRWLSDKVLHDHHASTQKHSTTAKVANTQGDEELTFHPGMSDTGIEVEELSLNEFLSNYKQQAAK